MRSAERGTFAQQGQGQGEIVLSAGHTSARRELRTPLRSTPASGTSLQDRYMAAAAEPLRSRETQAARAARQEAFDAAREDLLEERRQLYELASRVEELERSGEREREVVLRVEEELQVKMAGVSEEVASVVEAFAGRLTRLEAEEECRTAALDARLDQLEASLTAEVRRAADPWRPFEDLSGACCALAVTALTLLFWWAGWSLLDRFFAETPDAEDLDPETPEGAASAAALRHQLAALGLVACFVPARWLVQWWRDTTPDDLQPQRGKGRSAGAVQV